jgi:prophage regulatory protein
MTTANKCTVPPDLAGYRMLSRETVLALTGLSKVTLWSLVKAKQFPTPRQLSHRRIAWRQGDVLSWLESRDDARAAA